ncbi:MAG: hypothetical protein D6725_16430 [Planctomycetota bacterium]|nr:MAG: hypothetical protein D6725_16430 [Planctomycetota bacterium]
MIDFADDSMPPVLCTPALVWFLEHAARNAMLPLLEDHESTVGVEVQVEHLAPTPPGAEVHCQARVVYVDGRDVLFQFHAHDGTERIARGTHRLRVIDKARFRRRVEKKIGDRQ